MIRVVLVDDHPVVRSGYRRLLEQDGVVEVVAEAGDTDEGFAAFARARPDVLVTDLNLPGGGGLALTRRVLRQAPAARVLVFSMHDSVTLVQRALEAGADGFVTKASEPECLVEAVHALHGGRRYLGPDLPAALLAARPRPDDDALAGLSAREFEVFRLLALGHSAAECAAALELSVKTIANHQTTIKEKLGVGTSAQLVHLALRHGVIDPA